jgi:hypothetical protein
MQGNWHAISTPATHELNLVMCSDFDEPDLRVCQLPAERSNNSNKLDSTAVSATGLVPQRTVSVPKSLSISFNKI